MIRHMYIRIGHKGSVLKIIIVNQAEEKTLETLEKLQKGNENIKIIQEAYNIIFKSSNFRSNIENLNSDIKKNRLELLQMFCKTYNNFIDFSKVEGA